MGTVYLATDRKHARRVAIKVLPPDVAAALGPERFLREISIVARLTHPHILPLYDSGQASGRLYYVMPHVDGESLRQRLDQGPPSRSARHWTSRGTWPTRWPMRTPMACSIAT